MISFKIFLEELIATRRYLPAPLGYISDPNKRGHFIKDVKAYEKQRDDAVQYKTTTGSGSIVNDIRNDENNHIGNVMSYYGFSLKKGFGSLPKDGSLVYRGHKDPNPFSKGTDAKATGDLVYFSSNPEYIYNVYSAGINSSSDQIGQRGFNSLQSKVQSPNPNLKFKLGYFTIATPKNANNIKWYTNFGYENKKEGFTRLEKNLQENRDAECVEPKESFSKIRTYLIYEDYMISFDRLKKVQPDLYNKVMSSHVIDYANQWNRVV
tara:strand:+ start:20539 stop:21333 length:795 start_codon:yes stop_codon:yes gene_type:complete